MIELAIALGTALIAGVLVAPLAWLVLPRHRRPYLRRSIPWAAGAAFLVAFLAAWAGAVVSWPDPVLLAVQALAAAVAVLVLSGATRRTRVQVVRATL